MFKHLSIALFTREIIYWWKLMIDRFIRLQSAENVFFLLVHQVVLILTTAPTEGNPQSFIRICDM